MSQDIARSDLTKILGEVSPYLSEPPLIALLGGSQVINDGSLVTTKSDYDLIIVARHIERPVSLRLAVNGRRYDVIIRDPHTLQYDFEQAQLDGKGTLLHICRYGVPIHDPQNLASLLKEAAKKIYDAGPYAVSSESLSEKLSSIRSKMDSVKESSDSVRFLASFILAHDIGRTSLRAARQWHAPGKVLGRFLLDRLPGVKNKVEQGFREFSAKDKTSFQSLIETDIPALTDANGGPQVPFRREGKYVPYPDSSEEAFECIRTCPEAVFPYFFKGNHDAGETARMWIKLKFENAEGAINPERIGRPSNEYFYSLCAYLWQFAAISTLGSRRDPEKMSLDETLAMALERYPELPTYMSEALNGHPERLLAVGRKSLENLVGPSANQPLPPRISPTRCRSSVPAFDY